MTSSAFHDGYPAPSSCEFFMSIAFFFDQGVLVNGESVRALKTTEVHQFLPRLCLCESKLRFSYECHRRNGQSLIYMWKLKQRQTPTVPRCYLYLPLETLYSYVKLLFFWRSLFILIFISVIINWRTIDLIVISCSFTGLTNFFCKSALCHLLCGYFHLLWSLLLFQLFS